MEQASNDTIHRQKQQSLQEKQSSEFGPTLQGWVCGKELQDAFRNNIPLTNSQVSLLISEF
jgi:hypothetical protein